MLFCTVYVQCYSILHYINGVFRRVHTIRFGNRVPQSTANKRIHPMYILRPTSPARSLLVVTQVLGHVAGTSPPSLVVLRCAPSFLSGEEFSLLSPH